jgi:agmatinase
VQSRHDDGTPALIGVSYDASSSFIRGAAAGPEAIRRALHSPSSNGWSESGVDVLGDGALADEGDLRPPPDDSAAARAAIETAIGGLVARGRRPIMLGGDHSITYGAVRALSTTFPELSIVQFDAHPDLYDSLEGDRWSHACQFARILEEGLAKRLVQVGIRTMTGHQRDQAARFGVDVIDMRRWTAGERPTANAPVYLSIDLDGLDPAFAPGVSHLEPGGLSVRDVVTEIHRLGNKLVAADVVELNPTRDVNSMTAFVAAKLVKEIAAQLGSR